SISSIAVVNNEVFMSGMFQKANSSSFSLLKWNGTTITEVFAFGISVPTVVKMFVVSHHLFAEYTIQGFRHFGYWNGSGFTGLGDVVLGTSGSIDAVTEMSNIVYVGGTFSTFDGVTVNNIAQHGVVVGIENILEESPLGFYPNPATGYIVLDASDELRTIAVYNALGQLCHQYLLNAGECFLSLEDLQPGAYIVRAVSREKIQTGRVIIE
ncbi:MAG: T9SS type A sorting domain-containing protein, partial [Crocinitomicaceae bacterium]|nr:T9SS type A sorting domain-containing protein [Crocinitomicaceae bacterium]